MNTMTYKGYIGSVAFSEKDNVFFGKIEGINGLVNFEGESVKELTNAFHEAVEDYIAYCKDEGMQCLWQSHNHLYHRQFHIQNGVIQLL